LTDTNEVYYYNVTHVDIAGNWNSTQTRNITLDTRGPVVRLDAPLNNTWSSSGNVNFSYTPTDLHLEVCTLYHNETGWKANEFPEYRQILLPIIISSTAFFEIIGPIFTRLAIQQVQQPGNM